MRTILLVLFCIVVFLVGAVAHEADMSRNFKRTGDAKAWLFEIKCEKEEVK